MIIGKIISGLTISEVNRETPYPIAFDTSNGLLVIVFIKSHAMERDGVIIVSIYTQSSVFCTNWSYVRVSMILVIG